MAEALKAAKIYINGRLIGFHDSPKELTEELHQDGGFAITHVGVLKQSGGKTFKISEGLDQIKALGFFLSFAEGRWCRPVLLIGTRNDRPRSF